LYKVYICRKKIVYQITKTYKDVCQITCFTRKKRKVIEGKGEKEEREREDEG
jgi:hypothetical protein